VGGATLDVTWLSGIRRSPFELIPEPLIDGEPSEDGQNKSLANKAMRSVSVFSSRVAAGLDLGLTHGGKGSRGGGPSQCLSWQSRSWWPVFLSQESTASGRHFPFGALEQKSFAPPSFAPFSRELTSPIPIAWEGPDNSAGGPAPSVARITVESILQLQSATSLRTRSHARGLGFSAPPGCSRSCHLFEISTKAAQVGPRL